MNPIIKVSNIFHERDHVILDHLIWTVSPGENWIVMGANGCGKSTLIHIITSYFHPSSQLRFLFLMDMWARYIDRATLLKKLKT
jgi:ABC-type molybdenum transport system ATPase subunit/photorepair protein PhrA